MRGMSRFQARRGSHTPSVTGAILAVDLGGTKVAAGLYDPSVDQFRAQVEFPVWLPAADPCGPPNRVLTIEDLAARLLAFVQSSAGPIRMRRIAVSIAAAPSPDGRVVRVAPNLPGFEGPELVHTLEARFSAPAHLLQDGHATAAGELYRGALRSVHDGLCVAIGTGIGGGIVSGGALVRGRDGLAGVAGYIPVASQGLVMPLESACAGPAVARRAQALGLPGDAHDLLAAADAGNPAAERLLDELLSELGEALAACVSLLNPERIVLAGGLGIAYARYAPALLHHIARLAQPTSGQTVRLCAAELGERSALWGAALAPWSD